MPKDLFISYSREDNKTGRITQLVERIKADFEIFAGRPLDPFFDRDDIKGMDDWRHRILHGLRESRLLLACLSPSYLKSEYCEWEFNEYLKNELGQAYFGDGIAPVYFIEVPGWEGKGFEQQCAEWVAELRRRQHFDLRPWQDAGEEALRDAAVKDRMDALSKQIGERIERGRQAEQSLGNIYAHNLHFIGRRSELRRLRESVGLGRVGVLTAVHGLGGVGKTALAIEYAHAFAHEYGGGRWLARCEGKDDLRAVVASLQGVGGLDFEFTDEEKKDLDRQFERVLRELRKLANDREPHRCLLLLDNVDQPKLLEPAQTQRLPFSPSEDWLHVIATTRLGEGELFERHKDRAFVPVDELTEAEALELIRSYQPGETFQSEDEKTATLEIVRLLGCFTLAVEAAAVYLGRFADEITCSGFLARLQNEGLTGLDNAAATSGEGILHGEIRLSATIMPTLERLSEAEKLALSYAALLPADQVPLPWLRALVSEQFPEMGKDAEPGYPDPWNGIVRRLLSLRLLQFTGVADDRRKPLIVRMHRVLQDLLHQGQPEKLEKRTAELIEHVEARSQFLWDGWVDRENRWEIEPVAACAWHWMEIGKTEGAFLANQLTSPFLSLANLAESKRLLKRAVEIHEKAYDADHPALARDYSNLALVEQDLGDLAEAKRLLKRAVEIHEKAYEPDHPTLATIYSNLALVEKALGNLAEAKRLLKRAVEIHEKA
ncbi:MAG: tetratricopeptide repeat protein, partial [Syntrophobacteraceae bacterium]